MTWVINIGVSYIDTPKGQLVVDANKQILLDAFSMANIGAIDIVDDTILTSLNLNVIKINERLEPFGLMLYGIEKYGELEFKLDFIDPLKNKHISLQQIEDAAIYARHALIKAGFALTPWHFR